MKNESKLPAKPHTQKRAKWRVLLLFIRLSKLAAVMPSQIA